MKKLLALVLCVMLFVSVIPTAAFAGGTSNIASGISLYPLVKQENQFYGKLINYFDKSSIAGLANGFAKNYPKLIATVSGKEAMGLLQQIWNAIKTPTFDPDTGKLVPYELPETMTSWNNAIAQIWWTLGTAYVGTYQTNLGNANDGTLTGVIANAESKIPTVSEPAAFANLPA